MLEVHMHVVGDRLSGMLLVIPLRTGTVTREKFEGLIGTESDNVFVRV